MNIEVLAQQLGAKVIGKLDGQNSYLLEFPDEGMADAARDQLSHANDIAAVDSNYSMEKPQPFSMASVDGGSPFNLKASANGGDGNNIVIGLIDTAVQQLGAGMQGFLLPPLSTAGDANLSGDIPTHGTTMAESILFGLNSMLQPGQGTSLKILPIDIYGIDPTTSTFKVASGITIAVNNGANILSLSLGSEGNSPFLANLIDQVRAKNILIFAAAGNQPVTTPTYPAAYPAVIAVTSAQSKGEVASYANRGSFVDVILPGATVVPFNGASWYVNGTSVSTALASGMMAGLAERSRRPPAQLEETFRNTVRFQPPKP
jgi:thermitase